jgi:hypothetical protein
VTQSRSLRRGIEQHLLPRELVELCLRSSHREFLDAFSDTQLLLIQLDAAEDELAVGLDAASTVSGLRLRPTCDAIGFSTVMHEVTEQAPASQSIFPPRLEPTTLETRIVRRPHFVAPLRRRKTDRAFVEHISVGRARNSDIVLRHDSVSKFHAWFECDESGKFYVGDAKSKNGTKVNGVRIPGQPLTPLHSGDEVRFGRVATTICSPETFWAAVMGTTT